VSASPRCDRAFFATDAERLARRLLGQRLVRLVDGERVSGIIVETEAYLGVHDLASHAARGRRTPRNEAMYGDAGTAYVYFTYGVHHCFNLVCGERGEPAAVLVRALDVDAGESAMRRMLPEARRDSTPTRDLCRGPGRLCRVLAIDRTLNFVDMTSSDVAWIEQVRTRVLSRGRIGVSARIGVDYAKEWRMKPLRFFDRASDAVSGSRRLNS